MAWTIKQNAGRVLLLDPDDRLFLMKASDPIDPNIEPWWQIPGGRIDAGEDSAMAAERELYEETGIDEVTMGPCVWTQYVEFSFGGLNFKSNDFIHVARCAEAREWNPVHLEALEEAAFEGAKWWGLDELLENAERTLPHRLREFLPDVVAGDFPDVPIDITPL